MATDGRYIFTNCVPDGSIDIASIKTGDLLSRPWSFRVNAPVQLQQGLDNGTLDPRTIVRGYDGELLDSTGTVIAEVPEWHATVNVQNSDYHPGGHKQIWAITQGYHVSLTFTETVIRDARLLQPILASLNDGQPDAALTFQGHIKSRSVA